MNPQTKLENANTGITPELLHSDTTAAMLGLTNQLRQQREVQNTVAWEQSVNRWRQSEICAKIHEDPFTRHSFEKPRGYSGDAALLDMIYTQTVPDSTAISDAGRQIFNFTINSPAPHAVRQRRIHISHALDQLALEKPNAKVLSVACGHLRELDLTQAAQQLQITALDQDRLSLNVIGCDYPEHNIALLPLSIKSLLTRPQLPHDFDFIYSAGLYDYFSQPMARRVTKALFDLLAPGGKLLLANFCPEIRDVGYMECFMDWWLVYRNETEMQDLTSEIPTPAIAQQSLNRDPAGDIVYLELMRRIGIKTG